MELSNTFTVNLSVEDTWKVLTDIERIAPCLPGAALLGVEGDAYSGVVKIKVGPVSSKYQGIARFVEKDDQAHRAVLRAEGKDAGGQGNAAATVTVSLSAQGEGTKVDVNTDLMISGRVAQFGRGVIADVSNKMLQQFVQRLEAEFAPGVAGVSTPSSPQSPAQLHDIEPLNALASMGPALMKRAIPAVGILVLVIVGVLLARRPRQLPVVHPPVVINLSYLPQPGQSNLQEPIR
jgi:carbon monoxide dehydrogenase subunit G